MRKIDTIILFLGLVISILWTVVSSKDGFKGSNATIVARSIAINATIDGQIENIPPAVGAWVNSDDLLARIHNGRFDRSRLLGFESRIAYLESEIENVRDQQQALDLLKRNFQRRSYSYAEWAIKDLKLRHEEFTAQLGVAKATQQLENEEVDRAEQLFEKNLTSEVDMRIAKTQAVIADTQVDLHEAQVDRSALMLETMERDGVFFDNGDTSYWAKMGDTLSIRQFDNLSRISLLEAELIQAQPQAQAENSRINSSFAEEHRAPFTGVVSARFVTQGTRVTSGAALLQILDCANPVIIIPIPDNRVSDFSVGSKVSVYPIDSEEVLGGSISYISSGPMIGSDTSIQIQQDVTMDGNRAIASLNEGIGLGMPSQSCETARKAVVFIHTKSIFDTIAAWI